MPDVAKIQRNLLQEITRNDRVVRYLEGLAQEIDDSRPLTGTVAPEGAIEANLSRLYINTDTGDLWINANPIDRQSTGWLIK